MMNHGPLGLVGFHPVEEQPRNFWNTNIVYETARLKPFG